MCFGCVILIDLTFSNINRLFVLSFKNDAPARNSFDQYYMSLVEIKNFNTLIDNKPFLDQPVKKQTRSAWKTYWNGYKPGNLLDYLYYQRYHELTGIDN